jgi:hypothetical protein
VRRRTGAAGTVGPAGQGATPHGTTQVSDDSAPCSYYPSVFTPRIRLVWCAPHRRPGCATGAPAVCSFRLYGDAPIEHMVDPAVVPLIDGDPALRDPDD